jgi:hypothetical protein
MNPDNKNARPARAETDGFGKQSNPKAPSHTAQGKAEDAKYFFGDRLDGLVRASTAKNFRDIVEILRAGVHIAKERSEFLALPKPERDRLKQTRYLVPARFRTSPSRRTYAEATVCDLLILDIDDAAEAAQYVRNPSLLYKALWGFNFAAYETANSTADKPRLRVVVEADSIPKEKYAAAVETIGRFLGVRVNSESKNAVQPHYLPPLFSNTQEDGQ